MKKKIKFGQKNNKKLKIIVICHQRALKLIKIRFEFKIVFKSKNIWRIHQQMALSIEICSQNHEMTKELSFFSQEGVKISWDFITERKKQEYFFPHHERAHKLLTLKF